MRRAAGRRGRWNVVAGVAVAAIGAALLVSPDRVLGAAPWLLVVACALVLLFALQGRPAMGGSRRQGQPRAHSEPENGVHAAEDDGPPG